ncbi:AAA family ATPase [Paenibacillus xylanexedens]|uniref:AAA family ATPase n=1 Tax=Paenibacillus xylanexedens TaxID=528191 RepID=UPI0011A0E668|nr:AAA family ATPase [Paenibacillus xylanexedens]
MDEQQLRNIKQAIINFQGYIPAGKEEFLTIDSMDIKDLLSSLHTAFELEEQAIDVVHARPYVTDDYENDIMFFATQLLDSMVPIHNELKTYDEYKKLLHHRHVAYGFYNTIEQKRIEVVDVLNDTPLESLLYSGLVEFYQNYFGTFTDNQRAIKFLCKFFPKDNSLIEQKEKDATVKAIYRHITNAGTPSDFGFAFGGIERIREYIGYLPVEIIDLLLQKYELYKIVNKGVYRNQIFTIIDYSLIPDSEKQKYKFSFLDSLLIADLMNSGLYEKYGVQEHLIRNYLHLDQNLASEKLELITDTNQKSYGYWTNSCAFDRQFIINEKAIINIHLHSDNKQIAVTYIDNPSTEVIFEYSYPDWMLGNYRSIESEQKVLEFINEDHSKESEYIYRPLKFSLLYLNRYRGMKSQLINFDHKFTYDINTKELKASVNSDEIPNFYGNKVYSLSCIVGKNGMGKTSTVDFLRDTFFRLIHIIKEKRISCNNGVVNELEYEPYKIMENNIEFFIVFHLGDQPYYLTNINSAMTSGANAFNHKAYKSRNELSKVVYFSSMLSVNQDSLFDIEGLTTRREKIDNEEDNKSNKEDYAKSLIGSRHVDYSENSSFIEKRNVIKNAIINKDERDKPSETFNKDLFYQLAFLDYLSQEDFLNYFDFPDDKIFFVMSNLSELPEKQVLVKNFNENLNSISEFLTLPDAKLGHFSSGQHAKFSFLSKLYWFLEGHGKYSKTLEDLVKNKLFSDDEALQEGETALLFIDEGELFYHPEWQRNYIKILLDLIHASKTESKIQIVITTNSPFIISDVLSEDISYLSKEDTKFDQTFGQNIHKLLTHNFFMNYTIGEFSREFIVDVSELLSPDENNNIKPKISAFLKQYFDTPFESEQLYEKMSQLINKIGEQVYREKLMLTLSQKLGKDAELDHLVKQRAELDHKIKQFKLIKERKETD